MNNRKNYLQELKQKVKYLNEEIERNQKEIQFTEYQINEAKKEGKKAFDPDKYRMVKK